MMLLERRITWPNYLYIFLFLLMCLTVAWQISMVPPSKVNLAQYNTAYNVFSSNTTYSFPASSLPLNDYNQLINLNFSFPILNLICNDTAPFLLVLVHSSPGNFAKRRTIRETWGSFNNNVRVVFMVGLVKDADLQLKLEEENDSFGDFVQGSFLDTYRNLTYKHVMVFKYVIYHCPQAKYVLKTDDDVFVNMPTMMNFLMGDLSPYGSSKVLFCTPQKNAMVFRTYRSKWRVSFSEYADRKYPTYCPGWILLYSPDVVFDLYREAQKSAFFWIDDIHITGTLVGKLHLVHTNIEPLVLNEKNLKYIIDYSYNVTSPFLFGGPNINERQIRGLWEFVKSRKAPKTVLKDVQLGD